MPCWGRSNPVHRTVARGAYDTEPARRGPPARAGNDLRCRHESEEPQNRTRPGIPSPALQDGTGWATDTEESCDVEQARCGVTASLSVSTILPVLVSATLGPAGLVDIPGDQCHRADNCRSGYQKLGRAGWYTLASLVTTDHGSAMAPRTDRSGNSKHRASSRARIASTRSVPAPVAGLPVPAPIGGSTAGHVEDRRC